MSLRKNILEFRREDAPASSTEDAFLPMTARQVMALKTLAGLAGDTDAYDETLTKAEATRRITALEVLLASEEHSGVDRLPRT
jgi:hypothetical protein